MGVKEGARSSKGAGGVLPLRRSRATSREGSSGHDADAAPLLGDGGAGGGSGGGGGGGSGRPSFADQVEETIVQALPVAQIRPSFDARPKEEEGRSSRISNVVSFLGALAGGHQAAFMFDPQDRAKNDSEAAKRKSERMRRASDAAKLNDKISERLSRVGLGSPREGRASQRSGRNSAAQAEVSRTSSAENSEASSPVPSSRPRAQTNPAGAGALMQVAEESDDEDATTSTRAAGGALRNRAASSVG